MFVDPLYRGPMEGSDGLCTSITALILRGLEEEAVGRGWTVLLLETGVLMGIARRFYERCGYVRREVFEGYSEADNSVYYKKRLDSSLVAPILLDGHDAKGHDGETSRPAWDVSKQSLTQLG
jgi:ribosomal protein S18 acetylase RimI-like enzyme